MTDIREQISYEHRLFEAIADRQSSIIIECLGYGCTKETIREAYSLAKEINCSPYIISILRDYLD